MGLAGLPPVDAEKVRLGNALLNRTLALIRLATQLNIPISVENPRSSLLWKTPGMARALRSAHIVNTVFCAFGTPWQKSHHVCNMELGSLGAAPGLLWEAPWYLRLHVREAQNLGRNRPWRPVLDTDRAALPAKVV